MPKDLTYYSLELKSERQTYFRVDFTKVTFDLNSQIKGWSDFNSWECRKGISDGGTDLSKGAKAENYKVLSESCENRCWKSLDPDAEELK